jgi:hypothetical protein
VPDLSPWHGRSREDVARAHAAHALEHHEAGPEWCPECGPLLDHPAYLRGVAHAANAALPPEGNPTP